MMATDMVTDNDQTGILYELWDYESCNLLWTYSTPADALAAIRQDIERHGRDYVTSWALDRGDDEGEDEPILEGPALIETALKPIGAP